MYKLKKKIKWKEIQLDKHYWLRKRITKILKKLKLDLSKNVHEKF